MELALFGTALAIVSLVNHVRSEDGMLKRQRLLAHVEFSLATILLFFALPLPHSAQFGVGFAVTCLVAYGALVLAVNRARNKYGFSFAKMARN